MIKKLLIAILLTISISNIKAAIGPSVGLSTAIKSGNSLFVDAINGNDSTGSRVSGTPFLTIRGAKAIAIAGDTIFVRPGMYNETDLLKSNVNYFFFSGAIVSNSIPSDSSTNFWGIFDDRISGAAGKTKIGGQGEFIFRNSDPFNLSTRGCIVVTNPLTELYLECASIKICSSQGLQTFAGISVANCKNVTVKVNEIVDLFELWNGGADISSTIGIYWGMGEMYASVNKIETSGLYGIWCEEPSTKATNNFYFIGERVSCTNLGAAAIYVSATGTSTSANSGYRSWFNCEDIIGYTAGLAVLNYSKVYVTAQKISALDGASGQAINNQGETWINVEKISGNGQSLVLHSGATISAPMHITAQFYEDLSTTAGQKIIQNTSTNTLYIHGGTVIGGTNFTDLVKLGGSSANTKIVLENVTLDGRNAATSTGAYPIELANSVGQLELDNVRIFTPALMSEVIKQSVNVTQGINILGWSYVDRQLTNKVIPTNGFLQVYQSVQATTNTAASPVQLAFTPNASTNFYPYTSRIYSQLNGGICSNITTVETSMLGTGIGSTTLRAGFWKVGNTITWNLNGLYWTGVSPGNTLVNVKLGSTIIASNLFAATASMTARPFYSDGIITCITNGTGAVGALLVGGKFHAPSAAAFVVQAFTNTITILDTTVDLTFDITATNGALTTGWLTKNLILNNN